MATKKELVEAQTFSKRRLLTAFTSGAPGGRELEPTTPAKGVVAGLVLAVLVVGGGFAGGLFNRGLPEGWENGSIVVVRDNAARYITDDGVLVPVRNMASARLLLAPPAPIITVKAKDVEDYKRTSTAGIEGAPDSLPAPSNFVTDGWRTCLADDGVLATELMAPPPPGAADPSAVPDPQPGASAALVSVSGQLFLVQGATSYALPRADEMSGVLRELGFIEGDAREVPSQWLALFAEGAPILPFTVAGTGEIPPGDLGNVDGVVVGSVVLRQGSENRYLVLSDGQIVAMSPFAAAIYRTGGEQREATLSAATLATVSEIKPEDGPVPALWPLDIAEPLTAEETACARLDAERFSSFLVPGERVAQGGVRVQPGTGALAQFTSAQASGAGPVRFIDENGRAYPIVASPENSLVETLIRLFPTGTDQGPEVLPVPYAWGELFQSGPVLSVAAAQSSLTVIEEPEG